jgi:hypothetical protein
MAGPRVFTIEEANGLVPQLLELSAELDRLRAELRTAKIRVDTLELIWGEAVRQAENPDHGEFQHHIEELGRLKSAFERGGARIEALGGQVKGLEPLLVDFLGVREGRLVCWCWTRGETGIVHWHHVDEGFAGRKPL